MPHKSHTYVGPTLRLLMARAACRTASRTDAARSSGRRAWWSLTT